LRGSVNIYLEFPHKFAAIVEPYQFSN